MSAASAIQRSRTMGGCSKYIWQRPSVLVVDPCATERQPKASAPSVSIHSARARPDASTLCTTQPITQALSRARESLTATWSVPRQFDPCPARIGASRTATITLTSRRQRVAHTATALDDKRESARRASASADRAGGGGSDPFWSALVQPAQLDHGGH